MTDDEKAQRVLELLAPRRFAWVDIAGMHVITETEIREKYYDRWTDNMIRTLKSDEVDFETCLHDFMLVHWAKELL